MTTSTVHIECGCGALVELPVHADAPPVATLSCSGCGALYLASWTDHEGRRRHELRSRQPSTYVTALEEERDDALEEKEEVEESRDEAEEHLQAIADALGLYRFDRAAALAAIASLKKV